MNEKEGEKQQKAGKFKINLDKKFLDAEERYDKDEQQRNDVLHRILKTPDEVEIEKNLSQEELKDQEQKAPSIEVAVEEAHEEKKKIHEEKAESKETQSIDDHIHKEPTVHKEYTDGFDALETSANIKSISSLQILVLFVFTCVFIYTGLSWKLFTFLICCLGILFGSFLLMINRKYIERPSFLLQYGAFLPLSSLIVVYMPIVFMGIFSDLGTLVGVPEVAEFPWKLPCYLFFIMFNIPLLLKAYEKKNVHLRDYIDYVLGLVLLAIGMYVIDWLVTVDFF